MRKFFCVALLLIAGSSLRAQVQYSINNLFRYGEGHEFLGGSEPAKQYIENLANVRLYWTDFTIGFRYQYDNPPEFGPRFIGVKKRYVEFARSGLELRAGDFYTLYGRGLAMNLFENRGINYDTGLDGFRAGYTSDYFNAIMAMGKFDYNDLLKPTRIENYVLKSGTLELKPLKGIRFGGSFVHADGTLPDAVIPVQQISTVQADIPEANLFAKFLGFDLAASYASKRSTSIRNRAGGAFIESVPHTGDAIYGSLSYASEKGLGVTFEYKDYRFDVVNQRERSDTRDTRMLPFQNPPVVFKEHSFTLLTRAPHIIDFNDEIGMQLDAFYQVTPGFTLNLNGSMASRHERYATYPNTYILVPVEKVLLFPSLSAEFAPFWEAYVEGEWYFTDESYVRFAFSRRYNVTNDAYDFVADRGEIHTVAATTIPIRVEYAVGEGYSAAADLEMQRVHDSQLIVKPEYETVFLALTLTRAPHWALTTRLETTTSENEPSGKKFWAAGEITYRLGNAHTLSVSYGTERGGLICASGICRQVNPFNGLRMTIVTQL